MIMNYLQKAELDLSLSDSEVHGLLESVSHSCDEMLVRCKFEGYERDCMEIFSPTITDDGQCCGFNIMPEHIMFRNKEDEGVEEDLERWSKWNIQEGYAQKPDKGRPICDQNMSVCVSEYSDPPR